MDKIWHRNSKLTANKYIDIFSNYAYITAKFHFDTGEIHSCFSQQSGNLCNLFLLNFSWISGRYFVLSKRQLQWH